MDTIAVSPWILTSIFPSHPTFSYISGLRDSPFVILWLCHLKMMRLNSNRVVILPREQVLLMKNSNEIIALEKKTN